MICKDKLSIYLDLQRIFDLIYYVTRVMYCVSIQFIFFSIIHLPISILIYISFRKKIKHEDSSENRFYRDSEYMFRLPV